MILRRNTLFNAIAIFFITLYLYTGISKLVDIATFKEQLKSSPFFGSTATIIAWCVPFLELSIALLIFLPSWRVKGIYLSMVLMTLFTIYLVVLLQIDNSISCSCGGFIQNLSPTEHLIFNGTSIGLGLVAIFEKQNRPLKYKWISPSMAILLFTLLGVITSESYSIKGPVKTGMEGRLLPPFDLLLTDSSTLFNTRNIPQGKPFVIIGFSPFCIHCQQETREIIKHIDQLKNIQIYLVTPFAFKDMKAYYNTFHLEKFPNIIMGKDSKNYFLTYFKSTGIPYTAIFDPNKRLKLIIRGETNFDQLKTNLTL